MTVQGPDVGLGSTWPELATFRELALAHDRRVIPVIRRFLADGETPIGLYRKLAHSAPGTFLLESVEQAPGPGGASSALTAPPP